MALQSLFFIVWLLGFSFFFKAFIWKAGRQTSKHICPMRCFIIQTLVRSPAALGLHQEPGTPTGFLGRWSGPSRSRPPLLLPAACINRELQLRVEKQSEPKHFNMGYWYLNQRLSHRAKHFCNFLVLLIKRARLKQSLQFRGHSIVLLQNILQ